MKLHCSAYCIIQPHEIKWKWQIEPKDDWIWWAFSTVPPVLYFCFRWYQIILLWYEHRGTYNKEQSNFYNTNVHRARLSHVRYATCMETTMKHYLYIIMIKRMEHVYNRKQAFPFGKYQLFVYWTHCIWITYHGMMRCSENNTCIMLTKTPWWCKCAGPHIWHVYIFAHTIVQWDTKFHDTNVIFRTETSNPMLLTLHMPYLWFWPKYFDEINIHIVCLNEWANCNRRYLLKGANSKHRYFSGIFFKATFLSRW